MVYNIEKRLNFDAGETVNVELKDSMIITGFLGDLFKSMLSPELQNILSKYEEAINATHDIEARLIFKQGFDSAMKSIEQPV